MKHMIDHEAGKVHRVLGSGGVGLHVREWGPEGAQPILFIHGWSAAYLSWHNQFDSPLREAYRIVCMDLRGHGFSDKPLDPEMYQTGAHWADDIAAVMIALSLKKPVLVGWSYGGFVIGDYLARHGTKNVGAVNFVGAAVISSNPPRHIGESFIDGALMAASEDPAVMIEGVRHVVHATTYKPLPTADIERAMVVLGLTPPAIRAFLLMRTLDFTEALENLDRPCLISQGDEDGIVLPSMAEHIANHVPDAKLSRYAACGHAPHQEHPAQFNEELAMLAARVGRD
ncbi:alpha/beta fold hydrolase [Acidiphilium acidophilum]|uniref:Alpha/beta hydrolase n=1 Tax=Acidiphilium acidophilum TaxID=76588 RepID=A0AAW9DS00_ACIAO|nr:alpha/beta hydrolase [Acidiphilium acidophilum]MDX5931411.1 alpha/beta hydrolase [Acidiphilium acidophilum]